MATKLVLLATLVLALSFLVVSNRTTKYSSVDAATSVCTNYQYSSKWGSYGTANGQFTYPSGSFIKDNYIYIADGLLNRVQKLTLTGTFVGNFGSGMLNQVADVAVDSQNFVYVADAYNNRVLKFDPATGNLLSQITLTSYVLGVAVDSAGNIYTNDESGLVKKFSPSGNQLASWNLGTKLRIALFQNYLYALGQNVVKRLNVQDGSVIQWGSTGTQIGQFNTPFGIGVDSSGYVYVTDNNNTRVQKFTPDGTYVTSFGSSGPNDGQFLEPTDVSVDASGNVYVTDVSNSTYTTTRNKVFIFTCASPTPTPTPTPAAARLLGWWKLNENTGTVAKDSSGNNFNGTVSNATWVSGKYGSALRFLGVSTSRVTIPTNPIVAPAYAITAEAWFKTSDTSLPQTIISKKNVSGYRLEIRDKRCASGTISFLVVIGGSNRCVTYPLSNIANNTWYYVTGTYDGISLKLYINGNLVSSVAQSGLIDEGTQPLCIGGDAANTSCTDRDFFKGVIDDVRIYNYARTPTQIASDKAGL